MFRNNENTLSFFQVEKADKWMCRTTDEKLCSKIISEVKQYGNAYCYNERIQNILKSKGYKIYSDGLVEL